MLENLKLRGVAMGNIEYFSSRRQKEHCSYKKTPGLYLTITFIVGLFLAFLLAILLDKHGVL